MDELRGSIESDETLVFSRIIKELGNLTPDAQARVIRYVHAHLGYGPVRAVETVAGDHALGKEKDAATPGPASASSAEDIRSLKEQKNPGSSVEMAVLVAYYIQELAPPSERDTSIGTTELKKYFKQANFRL